MDSPNPDPENPAATTIELQLETEEQPNGHSSEPILKQGSASDPRRRKLRGLDLLLESAPLVLGLAALLTIVVYMLDPVTVRQAEGSTETIGLWNEFWQALHQYGNYVAILAGLIVAVGLVWRANRSFDRPSQVNPRQFVEILLRHDTLATRQEFLSHTEVLPPSDLLGPGALMEAEEHLAYVRKEMLCDDEATSLCDAIKWQLGIGYLEMWLRVHRAEEALCMAEPYRVAIANLEYDRQRLTGSAVPSKVQLIAVADAAIDAWNRDQDNEQKSQAASDGVRFAARLLRLELNVFRDMRRDGLIQARYRVMWTGMVTGFVGYALLVLALLFNPGRFAVATAAALFLVAAVVGLFSQLHHASGDSSTVLEDDFGLTRARLVWTPLLSGFAGVAGVVLMAMFTPVLEQVSAGRTAPDVPALSSIFNLTNAPFALIIAAIFGLTPSLVINRLQGEANRLKAEFQSTSTTTANTTTTST